MKQAGIFPGLFLCPVADTRVATRAVRQRGTARRSKRCADGIIPMLLCEGGKIRGGDMLSLSSATRYEWAQLTLGETHERT